MILDDGCETRVCPNEITRDSFSFGSRTRKLHPQESGLRWTSRRTRGPTGTSEKSPVSPGDPPYVRHSPTQGIVGYIVNTHDPVNFDIDLYLPPELRERYWHVITNTYEYQDGEGTRREKDKEGTERDEKVGEGTERDKKSEDLPSFPPEKGLTYRCRLKGVGIVTPQKKYNRFMRAVYINMIRQIDLQGGWVLVTISDVDIYRRLLVELYDPITGRNLKDLLLTPTTGHLFYPYESNPLNFGGRKSLRVGGGSREKPGGLGRAS